MTSGLNTNTSPSLPEVKEKIQGYSFRWQEHGITIEVSKLIVHKSDSRVTGELTILAVNNAGNLLTIYPPTQFNFSAGRTRVELSNLLQKKKGFEGYPWALFIDQLCYGVQQRARRGEPVQELWTHEDISPPEYLIEPILFKGLPSVIFGGKGVAKSTLAIALYLCLSLPWHDNPFELKVPARVVKTLYLDWETEGNIIQYYAKRILEGHEIASLPILYRRCTFPLADDLERIQQHIAENKVEVIIIDSLGAACGSDLMKPEFALNFFNALRQLKVSSLIIAQTKKDEDEKRATIFGSAFFSYYSRCIWELRKAEGTSEDDIDIALFHQTPNLTKLHKPIGIRLHYNNAGLSFERRSVDFSEFGSRISKQKKLLELLKQGAMKPKAIAEGIESSEGATRVLLTKLKKRGQVIQVSTDGWGLPTQDN